MEIEKAKAESDRAAQSAIADAERAIGRTRLAATAHVTRAAQEAAADIVRRLIGESIATEDAASAVSAAGAASKS